MKTPSFLILPALVLLPLAASAQDAQDPRVAVVPFAALSGDVPQRSGQKAAAMFSSELKSADGFALVDVRKQAAPDPHAEALEAARAAVKEAEGLRKTRKFSAAEAALTKALEHYKEGAAGLTEVGELQDAYVLLSAIQFNTGRDDEGHKSLDTALGLSPTRELPLAKTSPLFTRVVNDTRARLEKAPRGTLLVESTPAGAQVFVDGVALGNTPLQINDVPPGLHTWRVQLPTGESAGGVAQVTGAKQTKVHGEGKGQDPESRIVSALSQNKLDQVVVEAARQHATSVEADMLIFGALSRDGKGLALDSFVLEVSSGQLKRLPRSVFDAELLSAGMEFYNLVGKLASEGLKVGSDTRIPGPVSNELRSGSTRMVEVAYGKAPGADNAAALDVIEATTKEPVKREPLKRSPLKK